MKRVVLAAMILVGSVGCDVTEPKLQPAFITSLVEGEWQTAALGATLKVSPGVVVLDAHDKPVPNVVVNFAVQSGNGSITGAASRTDAAGFAAVGSWTLGHVAGVQSLEAKVGDHLRASIYATAANPCPAEGAAALPLDAPVSSVLEKTDCTSGPTGDFFADLYRVQLGSQASLRLVTAPSALHLRWAPLGLSFYSPPDIRVIVPAGTHVLSVLGATPNGTGSYTIEARSVSESMEGCDTVVGALGITTAQTLTASDCDYYGDGNYADELFLWIKRAQKVTITMSSTAFEPMLELWTSDGDQLRATGISTGASSTQITYTAASQDEYVAVLARNAKSGVGGQYSLSIQ